MGIPPVQGILHQRSVWARVICLSAKKSPVSEAMSIFCVNRMQSQPFEKVECVCPSRLFSPQQNSTRRRLHASGRDKSASWYRSTCLGTPGRIELSSSSVPSFAGISPPGTAPCDNGGAGTASGDSGASGNSPGIKWLIRMQADRHLGISGKA